MLLSFLVGRVRFLYVELQVWFLENFLLISACCICVNVKNLRYAPLDITQKD